MNILAAGTHYRSSGVNAIKEKTISRCRITSQIPEKPFGIDVPGGQIGRDKPFPVYQQ
jgi:hypothetical protein